MAAIVPACVTLKDEMYSVFRCPSDFRLIDIRPDQVYILLRPTGRFQRIDTCVKGWQL